MQFADECGTPEGEFPKTSIKMAVCGGASVISPRGGRNLL
jgi:hypothetical protein